MQDRNNLDSPHIIIQNDTLWVKVNDVKDDIPS